jgi:sortase A
VIRETGRTFITLGVLVLLFAGYQNWVTDSTQQSSQVTLTKEVTKVIALPDTTKVIGPATPLSTSPDPGMGHWIGVIQIPKINVKQVIVDGTDKAQLQLGPGHYIGSAMPGERGNVAIAGHRTTWGRPFRNLDKLRMGDEIIITTPRASSMYRIIWTKIVSPDDVSVLKQTPEATLTLTTCNPPYSAVSRFVVRAVLAAVGTTQTEHHSTTIKDQKSVTLAKQERYPTWPSYVYGLILALLLIIGERTRRRYRWRGQTVTVVVTLIVATPITLLWFNGIAHVLPAGI